MGIDWTNLDRYPVMNLSCRCGRTYRSQVCHDFSAQAEHRVTAKDPCPGCGDMHNIWRTGGDRETYSY